MKLYPYQAQGVKLGTGDNRLFLCDEMGLGKTPQALTLIEKQQLYPAIIVCPAVLKINWARELTTWTGRTTKIDDFTQDIIITNYERLRKLAQSPAVRRAQCIVFDESHYLKNHKSQRSMWAKEIAHQIPYKILITGTPIPNSVNELVSQLEILGRMEDFQGVRRFLERYAGPQRKPWGMTYNGTTRLDELHRRLSTFWVRRTKKEVAIDLPPMQTSKVPITILRQNDPESFSDIEFMDKQALEKKLPLMIDWVKNFTSGGEPIVLFSHHRSVISHFLDVFPDSSYILGGQDPAERQLHIDRFQQGLTPIILCSMTASNVGLTLTKAANCAFLELPWNPTVLEQAMARIHRISQTRPCTTYILYAEKSIDEYRMRTIYNKSAIISLVQEG